jgi:uncharacterized membrane protein
MAHSNEISHPTSVEHLRLAHKPLRNIAVERQTQLKPMDRLALVVTKRVGTMSFFFIIAGWSLLWLGWNLLAPKPLRFDPPTGFVLWLFISNLIQILLMPLLLVGQNVLSLDADLRAENDYEVNLKTERYVETILLQLERQNQILEQILNQQKVHRSQEADP